MTTPTITYATKVDRRSKRAMASFLAGHFRYDTAGGWNRLTSYANNVKVDRFVPNDLLHRAYPLLDVEEAFDGIRDLIHDWNSESNHRWQAGFNGRSGGYLVLYQGGTKPSGYKRICRACGQGNYRAESVACGRCASTNMADYAGTDIFTRVVGTDQDLDVDDFLDWEMYRLRDRVDLVMSFDWLCDRLAADFIAMCGDYDVVDELVLVPTTRRVLCPAQ